MDLEPVRRGRPDFSTKEIGMLARKVGVVLLASALALGACTTNPYTGERQPSKAAKGAGIGALAGAAIGALTNTSSGKQAATNAMIGAGIGALVGGGVGYYMDQQEKKLRQQLQGTGVSVTRVGDNIILNMPGNITFGTNLYDVNASFYNTLNSVGLVLKEYDKTIVNVMGHTDSTGSDQYNQELSQKRANSVAQYLIARGLLAQRFVVQGYGESRPVATNDTPEGRTLNRRVEIQLSPLTTS
jgi:outer membrane protein OmpA-like peptidoglycan-associated protein